MIIAQAIEIPHCGQGLEYRFCKVTKIDGYLWGKLSPPYPFEYFFSGKKLCTITF